LRFGAFEFDPVAGELRKQGMKIKLLGQPLDILALLLKRPGEIVTREELQKKLWPADTFVDFEHSLNAAVKRLRDALDDSADTPRYVETLPRRGYRYIGPIANGVSTSGRGTHWGKIVTPVIAAVTLAAGGYFYFHRTPKLTDKDTIVLADFRNTTGDAVFDDTLRQGLSVQLEQSPFLNLLSDDRISQTLALMAQPKDARLTQALAREVCQRTASAATIEGSISTLGNQYVLGLKAVNCRTGDSLADEQVTASRKELVLRALGDAATKIREKLGESLSSVQKYATPLEEATTPSLGALKAYSLGFKMSYAKGDTAALPFFKRAVELDPKFARAYLSLSISYGNLNEVGRAGEYARKAYELREKVSERERFSIDSIYYVSTTGDLGKAAQTFEMWQQIYPRDYQPPGNLGDISITLGNFEKALQEFRDTLRLAPDKKIIYLDIGSACMDLNRLDEAETVYKQAEQSKLDNEFLLSRRYALAFLKSDAAQMAQLLSASMGKPGIEDLLLSDQADTEGWYGKLKNAQELTRRAMESAQHNDAKETAASYQAEAALLEVESGNREKARSEANAAMKLAPNRDVRAMTGLALARAGDSTGAEKLAAELDRTFPQDTLVHRYWLPTIRAAVALERKDPNRAIELLTEASPIELGTPNKFVVLVPVYVRGEAYLALHDGNRAAAEFQKFIDHRGLVVNLPWGSVARLGLARAYAMQGDTVKARAAYQNFLTLWKDADPDIPILIEAKAEYAKIR
jgi:DNA-binding winged helix-turn-helix (wHTH) protein/Flp pilus assembly protein TadD